MEVTRFLVCCGIKEFTGLWGELAAEFGPELVVFRESQSAPPFVRVLFLNVPEDPRDELGGKGFMFEFRLLKPNMFEFMSKKL